MSTADRYILQATRGPSIGQYLAGLNFPGGASTYVAQWDQNPDRAALLSEDQVERYIELLGPDHAVRPEIVDPVTFDQLPWHQPDWTDSTLEESTIEVEDEQEQIEAEPQTIIGSEIFCG